MKKIKLFGNIADEYKAEWLLDVATPAEALRAINANRPGFLAECDAGDYVAVLVDESDPENTARQVTDENGLKGWAGETLFVVPRMSGDVAGVVAGVLGITVASSVSAVIAATVLIAVINTIIAVAISIAISAIAALIAGTPDGFGANETEAPENKPSYLFNGVVNTAKQGHRVPVLYGQMLVGSMVLSSRINTKDL